MKDTDILIIGAGATGLMAAHTLAKAGKQIILLEARNRIGGRIHTLEHGSALVALELGAEFIHGDLPLTKSLLDEAGIAYHHAGAAMWKYENGEFKTGEPFVEHWELLLDKLNALTHDITINDFLKQNFDGDTYQGLRQSVRNFVSGYDNADPARASAFSLRKEWQSEDEGAQYRIEGGYVRLLNYLANELKAAGGNIYLNAIVKHINWHKQQVTVTTNAGLTYSARQLLIAMPLGVLQADTGDTAAIKFEPPIPVYTQAINALGFGAVIKLLLNFSEAFWENKATEQLAGVSLKDMGYLFSGEEIPTWWTQIPQHSTMLTGWVGGPEAREQINTPNEELLQMGINSLANIFKLDAEALKRKLLSWHIVNWTADEFARGSYAYDTTEAEQSRKILTEPIEKTIFFAGEYLYDGTAMGTVEAALTSGLHTAHRILD